jgi:hypothetical protein
MAHSAFVSANLGEENPVSMTRKSPFHIWNIFVDARFAPTILLLQPTNNHMPQIAKVYDPDAKNYQTF